MADKYIMLELGDERTKNIADVISNDTSKKILDFLAEKEEASEADIAKALNIPIASVDYNLKKLEIAGLIIVKNVLWSVKGRKVRMFKLSKKMIVIGIKGVKLTNKFRGLAATFILTGIAALAVRYYYNTKSLASRTLQAGDNLIATKESAAAVAPNLIASTANSNLWLWFLAGGVFAMIIVLIINLKNQK